MSCKQDVTRSSRVGSAIPLAPHIGLLNRYQKSEVEVQGSIPSRGAIILYTLRQPASTNGGVYRRRVFYTPNVVPSCVRVLQDDEGVLGQMVFTDCSLRVVYETHQKPLHSEGLFYCLFVLWIYGRMFIH